MTLSRPILNKIKETIESIAPEATAYLYGSQARGDARLDSDIDLLILLPDHYQGKEFVSKKLDISGRLYDLSLSLGVDISPLVLVPKIFYGRNTPFTSNVITDRIKL